MEEELEFDISDLIGKKYQCVECDEMHDEWEDARACCNKFPRKIVGIRCPHCDDLITEEDIQ